MLEVHAAPTSSSHRASLDDTIKLYQMFDRLRKEAEAVGGR